ncbi:Cob(I)yrinic acid a,c-diamide adenosyltransferase [Pseudomonas saudiphocaensis]|uniref:Cob(I)yrinic acid a,c-diamide adenosyltransferase n=1 Tax=Pseudomonas saudiphocaensis TaxID=1499686 RepID=A0A078LTC4_9PSED|nr:Cob(I)yrinic acid a,c-diamide adenosyltransferase [Pseudomonas saudiphocaensis]
MEETDLAWLQSRLSHFQKEVSERLTGFVLPRGSAPVPQLHHARSCAKKAIRAMVRVDQEGIEVPLILPRLCNMMVNFFFVLTLVINQRRDIDEVPFVSKSYGKL